MTPSRMIRQTVLRHELAALPILGELDAFQNTSYLDPYRPVLLPALLLPLLPVCPALCLARASSPEARVVAGYPVYPIHCNPGISSRLRGQHCR